MSKSNYIRANKTAEPTSFRPDDEHIMQSMIYLWAFNNLPVLKKHDIKKWLIFYTLRENGLYNYFEMTITDESSPHGAGFPMISSYKHPKPFVYMRFNMRDIIKRWEELNFCLEHHILPDKDFDLTYSHSQLQALLANNYPYFGKDTKDKIRAGNTTGLILKKGTANERPVGDFQCYACPYKSKCWGLNNVSPDQFDCMHITKMSTRVKYSEFDPYQSKYFDVLTDESKEVIRAERGHN